MGWIGGTATGAPGVGTADLVIGRAAYGPATDTSTSVSSSTAARFLTTAEYQLAFTAPYSGRVDIRIGVTSANTLVLGVWDDDAAALISGGYEVTAGVATSHFYRSDVIIPIQVVKGQAYNLGISARKIGAGATNGTIYSSDGTTPGLVRPGPTTIEAVSTAVATPIVPVANGDPDDPAYLFTPDGSGLFVEVAL